MTSTAQLTDALHGFAPVALDELVGTAALLTRIDRKYVLTADAAAQVLGRLPGARVLTVQGRRGFGYDSLYLDTADLTGFHLAARGRRRRFKVRRRTYTDTGEQWVEVKTRGPRGATVKERVPGAGPARDFVDDVLGRSGIAAVGDLVPVLGTQYTRTTLLLGAADGATHGAARVTVDTDLVWRTPSGQVLALDDRVVVETKSGSAPSPADRLLWRAGHRPARISKFGTGLAALHPGLPRNRWHAVLTRHLEETP